MNHDVENQKGLAAMAGLGANMAKTLDLGRVAMPLVRLMNEAGLSWSDKQKIAGCIQSLINDHEAMKKEQAHIHGAMAGMGKLG